MIFVTHPDPAECAGILADDHIASQTEEVASALSSVLSEQGITSPMFTSWSRNEDLVAWARADWSHFMWLAFYGMALVEESDRRFGSLNKATPQVIMAGSIGYMLSDGNFQAPDWWPAPENRHGSSVFDYYKSALRSVYDDREYAPRWTKTYPPRWLADSGIDYR